MLLMVMPAGTHLAPHTPKQSSQGSLQGHLYLAPLSHGTVRTVAEPLPPPPPVSTCMVIVTDWNSDSHHSLET